MLVGWPGRKVPWAAAFVADTLAGILLGRKDAGNPSLVQRHDRETEAPKIAAVPPVDSVRDLDERDRETLELAFGNIHTEAYTFVPDSGVGIDVHLLVDAGAAVDPRQAAPGRGGAGKARRRPRGLLTRSRAAARSRPGARVATESRIIRETGRTRRS